VGSVVTDKIIDLTPLAVVSSPGGIRWCRAGGRSSPG
jgi:hypothetical protein